MTVRSSRDDCDIVGVVDGSQDSGGEDDLLPGLADVDDVDTWRLAIVSRGHEKVEMRQEERKV